jgi:glutamine synthetase
MTAIRASYIWLSGQDTHHDIRGKDRTLYFSDAQLKQSNEELLKSGAFPIWNFDGSSTEQAKGLDTEILIHPVRVFSSPFPKYAEIRRYIVLCECYLPSGEPTPDNTRYVARKVFDADTKGLKPWFGMEQEYVLMRNGRPLDWPANGYPAPQGPYYCGNGIVALGRKFAEKHYEVALSMGLKLSGINAEVMPSQWEFQVGPCEGIEMGDHLVVARWLFLRLLEEDGVDIDFGAKPVKGDWNGSGLHTNFSTVETRAPGGLAKIHEYIERMRHTVRDDIPFYGAENNVRLTGKHETSRYDQFSYGVGTRGTSIRIPNQVNIEKTGYFEDRRPAGNADPYLISSRLFASATGTSASSLEAVVEKYRLPWMQF